jgi:hypothetical protein
MNRCRLLLGAGALALLGLTVVASLLLIPRQRPGVPGVTRANYKRITTGMSKGEVEAILGGPGRGVDQSGFLVWNRWTGTDVEIDVGFADDKVYAKDLGELPPSTFWNGLRRLLPW